MADTNKIITALLRYSVDSAGIRSVTDANRRVIELLDQTKKQTLTTAQAADLMAREYADIGRNVAIDNLINDLIRAGKETKDWKAQIDAAATSLAKIGAGESEIRRVTQALAEAQGAQLGAGGRGPRGGVLGRFGREIRALPAVPLTGNLSTDVIGKVISTLGALPPVGLAAAAAIAAVTAAGVLYVATTEKQSAALNRLVASQEAYYRILEESTTEQATQELADAQQRLEALRTQRQEILGEQERQFRQSQEQTLGDLGARIRTAATQIFDPAEEAAANRVGELNTQITEQEGLIERLNNGLASNAFAANDAAAAEEVLLEARKKAQEEAVQRAREAAQREVDFQRFARTATVDGTQQRIADIELQIASNRQLSNSILESSDRTVAQSDELIRLAQNTALLLDELKQYNALLPQLIEKEKRRNDLAAIQAAAQQEIEIQNFIRNATAEGTRERLAAMDVELDANQRAIDAIRARGQLNEDEAQALEDLSARNKELNATYRQLTEILPTLIEQERGRRLADEAVKALEEQARAQEKLVKLRGDDAEKDALALEAILKQRDKAAQQLVELEQKYADDRRDLARKLGSDLARINRELASNEEDAAAERDVVASIQARKRAAREREELEIRTKEQGEIVDEREAREREKLQASAREQLAELELKLTRENATRQRALDEQAAALQNQVNLVRAIETAAQNSSLATWKAYWEQRLLIEQASLANLLKPPGQTTIPPGQTTSSLTKTGTTFQPQLFGTTAQTTSTLNQTSSTQTVTNNIYINDRAAIEQIAEKRAKEIVRAVWRS